MHVYLNVCSIHSSEQNEVTYISSSLSRSPVTNVLLGERVVNELVSLPGARSHKLQKRKKAKGEEREIQSSLLN